MSDAQDRVTSANRTARVRRIEPRGRPVKTWEVTLGGHRGRASVAAHVAPAHVEPSTSTIACAKACGAFWGRLYPVPPLIVRSEYLPKKSAS
jgi:hypothetical protein